MSMYDAIKFFCKILGPLFLMTGIFVTGHSFFTQINVVSGVIAGFLFFLLGFFMTFRFSSLERLGSKLRDINDFRGEDDGVYDSSDIFDDFD